MNVLKSSPRWKTSPFALVVIAAMVAMVACGPAEGPKAQTEHTAQALDTQPVSGSGNWSIQLFPTSTRASDGNVVIEFTLREIISGAVIGVREGSGSLVMRPDGTFRAQDCGTFVGSVGPSSGTVTMCVVARGAGTSIQGKVQLKDGAGGLAGVRGSATFTGSATGSLAFAGTYSSEIRFPREDSSPGEEHAQVLGGERFTSFDIPGAANTIAVGTNSSGDIVGRYCTKLSLCNDISGEWHGFLLNSGKVTSIDVPNAFHTNGLGINESSDIVGRYRDVIAGPFHGFLLRDGRYTRIDFPGAFSTRAYGVTSDGDVIVGDYCTDPGCIRPAAGHWHGFVLADGRFTSFDFPGALFTQVWRINDDGQIVGRYKGKDGAFHVFLLSHGTFTSIDFPGATNTGGDAGGINASGDIVSSYCNGVGCVPAATGHGFLLRNGQFTSIDFPGSVATLSHDINDAGDIIGTHVDQGGTAHGYVRQARGTEERVVRTP